VQARFPAVKRNGQPRHHWHLYLSLTSAPHLGSPPATSHHQLPNAGAQRRRLLPPSRLTDRPPPPSRVCRSQLGGSGVLVQPMTYIFDEEPKRWTDLVARLGLDAMPGTPAANGAARHH
jgi:hypothetical protein